MDDALRRQNRAGTYAPLHPPFSVPHQQQYNSKCTITTPHQGCNNADATCAAFSVMMNVVASGAYGKHMYHTQIYSKLLNSHKKNDPRALNLTTMYSTAAHLSLQG